VDAFFVLLVHVFWKAIFHESPPQEAYIAAPVLAVGFFPALWVVEQLSAWLKTGSVRTKLIALGASAVALSGGAWQVDRASQDGKITVLVARLGDDNDKPAKAARDRVMDSIRELLGPGRVNLIPIDTEYSFAEGASVDRQTLDIAARARSLL